MKKAQQYKTKYQMWPTNRAFNLSFASTAKDRLNFLGPIKDA